MASSYDASVEEMLMYGTGVGQQWTGILNLSGINTVTYTDASPTGVEMYPYIAQLAAQVADARELRPEVLDSRRYARFAWLGVELDLQNRPFSPPADRFTTAGNPDFGASPIGSVLGLPVMTSESIPATLPGTSGTQDVIIAAKPSDIILFESDPTINVFPNVLSGTLGVRIVYREVRRCDHREIPHRRGRAPGQRHGHCERVLRWPASRLLTGWLGSRRRRLSSLWPAGLRSTRNLVAAPGTASVDGGDLRRGVRPAMKKKSEATPADDTEVQKKLVEHEGLIKRLLKTAPPTIEQQHPVASPSVRPPTQFEKDLYERQERARQERFEQAQAEGIARRTAEEAHRPWRDAPPPRLPTVTSAWPRRQLSSMLSNLSVASSIGSYHRSRPPDRLRLGVRPPLRGGWVH